MGMTGRGSAGHGVAGRGTAWLGKAKQGAFIMKRVLVISDLHCGHVVGLTPCEWQQSDSPYYDQQRECWDFYRQQVKQLGPFDVVVVNGDAIDGKGHRSGASELITADRMEQSRMATAAIRQAVNDTTKIYMTYGTGYHTGNGEDWEDVIATMVGADSIESHTWLDIEGVVFDIKHHIGASGIPHGRYTAAARADVWNALWAERSQQPRCDVLIRSHVHYFGFSGDGNRLRITTPALQGHGSKFGARRCEGLVDYGFLVFDCEDGDYEFWSVLADLDTHKVSTTKVA
jgi:hypothetical protein